jgi:hypothetical protein
MINNEHPFCGKRFIGDKSTNKIHDFQSASCNVLKENAIPFDSLQQAYSEKYENCPMCLGRIFIEIPFGLDNFQASQNVRTILKQETNITTKIPTDIKKK